MLKILFLLLATAFLFVGPSCSPKKTLVNRLHFTVSKLQVGGVHFPPMKSYRYSWFMAEKDSLPEVQYIFDDTLLLSFSLNGRSQLVSLPNDRQSSYTVGRSKNEWLYFRFPGLLYVLRDGSFREIPLHKSLERLRKDGLMLRESPGSGNYVELYKDSFLIVPVAPGMENGRKYSDLLKPFPLFAKINRYTDKLSYLRYETPQHYLGYDHYVYHAVQSLVVGDLLYLYYAYSDQVDVYSLSRNKVIGQRSVKSMYQEDPVRPIPADELHDPVKKARYMVESANYGPMIYNPYKQHFYRIFYGELPEKNDRDEFTISSDKRCSICIYDRNFSFLGEYRLPKGIYSITGVTPVPEGMLINSSARRHAGGLKLTHISY